MKRDLITEITAIKSRTEFNSRHDLSRINDIEYAVSEYLTYNGDFDSEFIKYIPIATVACFEAFFKSVYKEMIDLGKPFSANAIKFNQSKNIKFDFDIVNAIQNKTVTAGEFISHILPCNNFEDINSNLSILAGIDFTDQIKSFKRKSVFDHVNENTDKFIQNSEQIILDVKRTFELRHIFCHEFATNFKIDREEIFRCFANSKTFLTQTNNFIWDLLYPNSPETQTEMNIQASQLFEKIENELSALIQTIKESSDAEGYSLFNPELLDNSIIEWKKYREAKAKLDASPYEGGSLYSFIYANSQTSTTKEKIESSKNEYEIRLRKYAGR